MQLETVRLIFAADIVYVVIPDGYIGRTTCYEVGRLVQAQIPIYFSETPKDLPLFVPEEFIASEDELIKRFVKTTRLQNGCFSLSNIRRIQWKESCSMNKKSGSEKWEENGVPALRIVICSSMTYSAELEPAEQRRQLKEPAG